MKEQDLDKYLNKFVKITDIDNMSYKGVFYKIVDGKFKINGFEQFTCINKGYVLDRGYCYYSLRKSHIKKIEIV